jgi:Tfp pilus assembly protein FimT
MNAMNPRNQNRQRGLSLIELMLTVAIGMTLVGFAIPTVDSSIANLKLRGSASDFSGLVQQARITAIQKNATYTILFGLPTGNGAYVDLNGNSSWDSGEPMIQFGGNTNQVSAPGGVGGAPTNLDASGGPLGWTATSGNMSFNSRGLPCNSSSTPCATNVNYIFYFKNTRYSGANGWAAVSITGAGRSKVWTWNGGSWVN